VNGSFDPMGSYDANGGGFMAEEKGGGKGGQDKKVNFYL